MPCVSNAHAVRAFLLASATDTRPDPPLSFKAKSHWSFAERIWTPPFMQQSCIRIKTLTYIRLYWRRYLPALNVCAPRYLFERPVMDLKLNRFSGWIALSNHGLLLNSYLCSISIYCPMLGYGWHWTIFHIPCPVSVMPTPFEHFCWLALQIPGQIHLSPSRLRATGPLQNVYGLLHSCNNTCIRIKTLTYIRLYDGDAISQPSMYAHHGTSLSQRPVRTSN